VKHTRITLIIHALGCGGAERVLSIMANYWAERAWHVTLITLAGPEEKPFFPLNARVSWSPLGLAQNSKGLFSAIKSNIDRVFALRRAIAASSPDVVVSFLDTVNVLTLFSCIGFPVPVIVSERTNPGARSIGFFWNLLRRLTYPRARAVVVQTLVAQQYFTPRVQERCQVIPNPVIKTASRCLRRAPTAKKIVGVGRLVDHKGFDLLLRAFGQIRSSFPDWQLVIWGEGIERPALERLARDFGIERQVSFPGQTTDVYERIREAELFVLSSRLEGFPNALCEAMACGVPAISFDLPAPREIIEHEVSGLLVPAEDCDALAKAMARLMQDESERERFAEQASAIVHRYSLDRIMRDWESLFSRVGAVGPLRKKSSTSAGEDVQSALAVNS
jgi:GalNAc-alpha-(1->4)-GalNAc-alpha-(1->3)-diNAcBac-PP-undecaprenol alpha-1,4-N-acetyl-D-galactosaminyltransferase